MVAPPSPLRTGLPLVWHGIGFWWPDPNPIAMKPNTERARKLMDTATRMMLAGNVERYLHALRLLFALRGREVEVA